MLSGILPVGKVVNYDNVTSSDFLTNFAVRKYGFHRSLSNAAEKVYLAHFIF